MEELWDNVKHPNIRIIGIPEEEDKKQEHEKIFEEIIVGNLTQCTNIKSSKGKTTNKTQGDSHKDNS